MKPKTDLRRVIMGLAGYAGAFCFSLAMLSVCLGVVTGDSYYTWWSLGLCAAGIFFWAGFLLEKIVDWFEHD